MRAAGHLRRPGVRRLRCERPLRRRRRPLVPDADHVHDERRRHRQSRRRGRCLADGRRHQRRPGLHADPRGRGHRDARRRFVAVHLDDHHQPEPRHSAAERGHAGRESHLPAADREPDSHRLHARRRRHARRAHRSARHVRRRRLLDAGRARTARCRWRFPTPRAARGRRSTRAWSRTPASTASRGPIKVPEKEKHMRRWYATGLIIAAATLVGCGDGSNNNSDGGGGGGTVQFTASGEVLALGGYALPAGDGRRSGLRRRLGGALHQVPRRLRQDHPLGDARHVAERSVADRQARRRDRRALGDRPAQGRTAHRQGRQRRAGVPHRHAREPEPERRRRLRSDDALRLRLRFGAGDGVGEAAAHRRRRRRLRGDGAERLERALRRHRDLEGRARAAPRPTRASTSRRCRRR